MHPFSLDSEARRSAFIAFAVGGSAAAWAQSLAFKAISIDVPWWVDTQGPIGFFGILVALWDRWLWKLSIMRSLHGVPDLSGSWRVEVASSYDMHTRARGGRARIRQSWSHISVEFEMPETMSGSTSGSILLDDGADPELLYTYVTRPKAGSAASLQTSEGQARLRLDTDGRLVGEYFTGRGRRTHGELILTREEPRGNAKAGN
jgi:hypothetical protein